MKWCLQDCSPSAKERDRSTKVQSPKPEEVADLVDRGTVYLYFADGEPDLATAEGRENSHVAALVQFWDGWVNNVSVGENPTPLSKVVQDAFGPYVEKQRMTNSQIVEAIQAIEQAAE